LYTKDTAEEVMMSTFFIIFFSVYKGLEMATYLSTVTDRVRKVEPTLSKPLNL
jgi:hypothetical protein